MYMYSGTLYVHVLHKYTMYIASTYDGNEIRLYALVLAD